MAVVYLAVVPLAGCVAWQFTMLEALQATLTAGMPAAAGAGSTAAASSHFKCPNCNEPLTPLDISTAAEASGGLLMQFQAQMRDTGINTLLHKLKDEVLDGYVTHDAAATAP
jgi:hypothetical protein